MAPKALIIDDEADLAGVLRDFLIYLYGKDIEVTVYNDGAAAYMSAFNNKYDFIITDHLMPGATGTQLLGSVRADNSINRETPVLVISAHLREAPPLPLTFFMSKPIDFVELEKECSAALGPPRRGEKLPTTCEALKILIADDDLDVLALLTQTINLGCDDLRTDIVTCATGSDAMKCTVDRFDLYILDHEMPGYKGLDVARQLRQHNQCDAPIIIFTGFAHTIPMEMLRQLRDVQILAKPFEIHVLKILLRRASIRQRMRLSAQSA